jgi:crossover junction endodeoxyribonuclease RuvC
MPIIFAIDPGYDRVGVAVLEKNESTQETLVFSCCITTDKKLSFYERLETIRVRLAELIQQYKPEHLVIEELYFAKNTTTALRVAEARGLIVSEFLRSNIPVSELHPNHIKIAITGYGAAKKTDILFMLPKLIKFDDTKRLDDELDAIAIGVAYFAHKKWG